MRKLTMYADTVDDEDLAQQKANKCAKEHEKLHMPLLPRTGKKRCKHNSCDLFPNILITKQVFSHMSAESEK